MFKPTMKINGNSVLLSQVNPAMYSFFGRKYTIVCFLMDGGATKVRYHEHI